MEKFKIGEEVFFGADFPYIYNALEFKPRIVEEINTKELKNGDKRYSYKIGYISYKEKDLMSKTEMKQFLQEKQQNIQNKIKQLD